MILISDINYYLAACLILFSYLVGSISFGILIAKFMNLGNLRALGSGNIGATNVLRTGNKLAAALTLILDSGKGYLVVYTTIFLFENSYIPFSGIAVFLGHIFPIYHKFKGGKGVATFLGIILAMNLKVGIMVCITWLVVALVSKKSSITALICSTAAPVFLILDNPDRKVLLTIVLTFMIWWLHKANINRLILKTEPSINFKNDPKRKS